MFLVCYLSSISFRIKKVQNNAECLFCTFVIPILIKSLRNIPRDFFPFSVFQADHPIVFSPDSDNLHVEKTEIVLPFSDITL